MNYIPQSIIRDGLPKMRRHVWDYRNAQGEIIGHVARFQGGKTKQGKVAKEIIPFFKRNGDTFDTGAAIEPRPLFGLDVLAQADHTSTVFVVEGEKCAAALQSMGLVAVTSQGGSSAASKADWKPLEGHGRVFILPDFDEAGEGYAKAVCAILAGFSNPPTVQIVRLPDLPDGGDVCDWIAGQVKDALLEWNEFVPVPDTGMDMKWLNTEFQKVVKAYSTPVPDDWIVTASEQATDWQSPVSLITASLPPWPDDVFPSEIQRFANGLAESTETPIEMASMLALAAMSAAVAGKYQVMVKYGYFEPINIWACVALPPANIKTAVQSAINKPLYLWEKEQAEIFAPLIKEAESLHATQLEKIKEMRKTIKACMNDAIEFTNLSKEIATLEADLPIIPVPPQVWTQDVTTEKLGTLMSLNDERMAVMSDEGGIFETMGGRYSGGVPNIDLYLQGHAGGAVKVDRGSRPSINLFAPALTMGLAVQPDVLRGITDNPSFRGRGLLGRFLYVMPHSKIGYRTGNTRPLSDHDKAEYARVITALLNLKKAKADAANFTTEAHTLKLKPDAFDAWKAFWDKTEVAMREGNTFAHFTDWAGKLSGAVIRIAGLLHCTRYAFEQPASYSIGKHDVEAAIRMADVLSIHALAAFDLMGADPALDGARYVLRWIEREDKPEFTFRDCHYAHKTRYKRTAELEPVMEVLIERHYIRPRVMKLVQGRPSRLYEINPAISESKS